MKILPPDIVRWGSVALLVLYVVAIALAVRRRAGHGAPREVKASRPLSLATGPLWVAIINASFVALLVEAIAPAWVYGGPLTITFTGDAPLQVLGVVAWLLGGSLVLWAGRALGRHTRLHIEVSKDHEMITSGPYRWIRHPMYTSLILINGGVALYLLNAAMAGVALVTYAIALRRALNEEQLLSSPDAFGVAYGEYMARTGRFLPRPGGGR